MTLTNNELLNINGGCFLIVFKNFVKIVKFIKRLF